MERYYSNFQNWEDYKNGMYCGTVKRDEEEVKKAKEILSNPILFHKIMKDLVIDWPIATRVNLSNTGTNRRAWLGAAACNYKHSVTEIQTRLAWNELNELQKFNANTEAEKIISEFELNYNAQKAITI